MAVMVQCPFCHNKRSLQMKKCPCGMDLVKAKKNMELIYWITYRADGRQYWEKAGTSLDDAKAADGKRKAQKKEGKILEGVASFKRVDELVKWYRKRFTDEQPL